MNRPLKSRNRFMMDTRPEIVAMKPADMPYGMRLSADEGWNQTEHEWQWLLEEERNVCLMATMEGKTIGTTTAANYQDRIAWIGMVLVDKQYRGMGISTLLLRKAFSLLENCHSLKLDATPAGYPVYKKLGFVDEYLIHRMTRTATTAPPGIDFSLKTPKYAGAGDIDHIVSMDAQIFGVERRFLLRKMAAIYPELCFVFSKGRKFEWFRPRTERFTVFPDRPCFRR